MRAHFVEVHVQPECVDAFKAASEANARESIQEPLVSRFDCYQQHDDPNRFMFVEDRNQLMQQLLAKLTG